MRGLERLRFNTKWRAMGCAMGATGLGLAYMVAAGAPLRYLAVNAGALVLGMGLAGPLSALWDAGRGAARAEGRAGSRAGGRGSDAGVVAAGVLLLATSVAGVTVNGATRWITVGGFALQPSLILLPVMVVWFARSRTSWSALGLVLAALAMALQPDRAMAGTLVAGLLALAVLRWERWVLVALCAAVAGFLATLLQVDLQPAIPFVDQILFTSFSVHPFAGLAVLGGVALLLAPPWIGRRPHGEIRDSEVAFGVVWLAVVAAAALGNYPTPLVGYGGSSILGYVVSAMALPSLIAATTGAGAPPGALTTFRVAGAGSHP